MNSAFWRKRKVLLTGHTGFKGSWLSMCLQSLGAEVCGYSLMPPTHPSLYVLADVERGMNSIQGDVLDLAHLCRVVKQNQPEIVFHLAAQSLVRQSYLDPVGTYATNVMGTAHLLQAIRDTPATRAVVIVTSDKCYENEGETRGYRETDTLGGSDPYSSSKAAAEFVTAAFRKSFFTSPKHASTTGIASVRAGNVIGGGDWANDRLIPDVVRAVSQCREIPIRNPHAVRPWQHVLDPLCGYLMVAERLVQEPSGYAESWNFGPDESDSLPVLTVLERLKGLWGPAVMWRLDDNGSHPPEATYLRLDSSKARTKLGWRPQWNLNRALEATVQWYKAHQGQQDVRALTLEQIQTYHCALSLQGALRR